MERLPQLFKNLPIFRTFFDKEEKYFDDIFAVELIRSKAFQRLKYISFLGAIDYIFQPNGFPSWRRNNRFQHSFGVGLLAKFYAEKKGLDITDKRKLVAAALAHDLGHPPLSHTLEIVFQKNFGIDHHIATRDIILGNSPLGDDFGYILDKYQIDRFEILGLIDGTSTSEHKGLFSGPINIDTIEAIYRCYTYISPNFILPPPVIILNTVINLRRLRSKADRRKAEERIDEFWTLKHNIYRYFIQNRVGLLADVSAIREMESNIESYSYNDFYLTEPAFRKRHPSLFLRLRSIRRYIGTFGLRSGVRLDRNDVADVRLREYTINSNKKLKRPKDLHNRYVYDKVDGARALPSFFDEYETEDGLPLDKL